jgi:hypothetical protein
LRFFDQRFKSRPQPGFSPGCAIKKPLRRERRGQLGKKLIQPPLRSGTKLSRPVKASFLIRQTPSFVLHLKSTIKLAECQINARTLPAFLVPDKTNAPPCIMRDTRCFSCRAGRLYTSSILAWLLKPSTKSSIASERIFSLTNSVTRPFTSSKAATVAGSLAYTFAI